MSTQSKDVKYIISISSNLKMKTKTNIKNILVVAILLFTAVFFINQSLAANATEGNEATANFNEATNDEEKNQSANTEEQTTSESTEVKLGKQIIAEDTKLKIVPAINATDIIEVKKDEEVNATEIINGWVCVETGTTKGWIRKEKLKSEEMLKAEQEAEAQQAEQNAQAEAQKTDTVLKSMYVNVATANVRKEANTTSEVVTKMTLNTKVDVLEEKDGWSRIKVNDADAYILSELLSDTETKVQTTSRSETSVRKPNSTSTTSSKSNTTNTTEAAPTTSSSGKGASVVATAKKYIGCKYVYGGSSPSGFDCSGFTSYVYKQFGVSLNRTAAGQYSNGVAVSRSNLQPGDLIMFGKSGISHVAIYIGGGKIVHAANPSRGVTTDTINSGYYNNNYVGARRVI